MRVCVAYHYGDISRYRFEWMDADEAKRVFAELKLDRYARLGVLDKSRVVKTVDLGAHPADRLGTWSR